MSSEETRRFSAFVTASLLVHAAALSWLNLGGADIGRLPSRISVLLESRSEGEGSRVKEPPASASRSRDLFSRPAARVAESEPAAQAEATATIAETAPAPKRAIPKTKQAPSARLEVATPAPEPKPIPTQKIEPAPPATVAAVAAPAEKQVAESAELGDSEASVATAGTASAPAAPDPGEAERQGELLSLLHQAISREKRYPLLARRQRREGTTTVIFSLSPSGEMDAIGVDRSSGFSLLDTAAVDAVTRVAPFGPARLFLSDVTRFKVDVTFKLY